MAVRVQAFFKKAATSAPKKAAKSAAPKVRRPRQAMSRVGRTPRGGRGVSRRGPYQERRAP